jgi:hypothetical protein
MSLTYIILCQAGVPTMKTAAGLLGVPLARILNLARKQGPCKLECTMQLSYAF